MEENTKVSGIVSYHQDIENKIAAFSTGEAAMYHYLLEMNIKQMRDKEEFSEDYIEEVTYFQTIDKMKEINNRGDVNG